MRSSAFSISFSAMPSMRLKRPALVGPRWRHPSLHQRQRRIVSAKAASPGTSGKDVQTGTSEEQHAGSSEPSRLPPSSAGVPPAVRGRLALRHRG